MDLDLIRNQLDAYAAQDSVPEAEHDAVRDLVAQLAEQDDKAADEYRTALAKKNPHLFPEPDAETLAQQAGLHGDVARYLRRTTAEGVTASSVPDLAAIQRTTEESLVAQLSHEDKNVRAKAFEGVVNILNRYPHMVERLIAPLLSEKPPKVILSGLKVLVHVGETALPFKDRVMTLTSHEDPEIRRNVVQVIGNIGGEFEGEAIPRLLELVEDPSEEVSLVAHRSLWMLGHRPDPRETMYFFLNYVSEEHYDSVKGVLALQGLAVMGKEAGEALSELARAQGELGTLEIEPEMIDGVAVADVGSIQFLYRQQLAATHNAISRALAVSAGALHEATRRQSTVFPLGPEQTEEIRDGLQSTNADERIEAMQRLTPSQDGYAISPEWIPLLRNILVRPVGEVGILEDQMVGAVYLIMHTGEAAKEAIPDFIPLLESSSDQVRQIAAQSLTSMIPHIGEEDVESLKERLEHELPETRWLACKILHHFPSGSELVAHEELGPKIISTGEAMLKKYLPRFKEESETVLDVLSGLAANSHLPLSEDTIKLLEDHLRPLAENERSPAEVDVKVEELLILHVRIEMPTEVARNFLSTEVSDGRADEYHRITVGLQLMPVGEHGIPLIPLLEKIRDGESLGTLPDREHRHYEFLLRQRASLQVQAASLLIQIAETMEEQQNTGGVETRDLASLRPKPPRATGRDDGVDQELGRVGAAKVENPESEDAQAERQAAQEAAHRTHATSRTDATTEFTRWLKEHGVESYAAEGPENLKRLHESYLILSAEDLTRFELPNPDRLEVDYGTDSGAGTMSSMVRNYEIYRATLDGHDKPVVVVAPEQGEENILARAKAYALLSLWGIGPRFHGVVEDPVLDSTTELVMDEVRGGLLAKFWRTGDSAGPLAHRGDYSEESSLDKREAPGPINQKTLEDLSKVRAFFKLFAVTPNNLRVVLGEDGSVTLLDPQSFNFFEDQPQGQRALDFFLYRLMMKDLVPPNLLPASEAYRAYASLVRHEDSPEEAVERFRVQGFPFPAWTGTEAAKVNDNYEGFVAETEKRIREGVAALQRKLAETMQKLPGIYVFGRCSSNVRTLIEKEIPKGDWQNANVLFFIHSEGDLVDLRASILSDYQNDFHVVLEIGGRIYDYDYKGRPGTPISEYRREMFADQNIGVLALPIQEFIDLGPSYDAEALFERKEDQFEKFGEYAQKVEERYGHHEVFQDLEERQETVGRVGAFVTYIYSRAEAKYVALPSVFYKPPTHSHLDVDTYAGMLLQLFSTVRFDWENAEQVPLALLLPGGGKTSREVLAQVVARSIRLLGFKGEAVFTVYDGEDSEEIRVPALEAALPEREDVLTPKFLSFDSARLLAQGVAPKEVWRRQSFAAAEVAARGTSASPRKVLYGASLGRGTLAQVYFKLIRAGQIGLKDELQAAEQELTARQRRELARASAATLVAAAEEVVSELRKKGAGKLPSRSIDGVRAVEAARGARPAVPVGR